MKGKGKESDFYRIYLMVINQSRDEFGSAIEV